MICPERLDSCLRRLVSLKVPKALQHEQCVPHILHARSGLPRDRDYGIHDDATAGVRENSAGPAGVLRR